ncbi:hypothetical protein ZWY2020_024710 [Hordeum vulgare]|nr:hypothetical protein ZWY2020_024710 [Hordeum vulgare]
MLGTAGAGHRRGYRPITRSPSPHSPRANRQPSCCGYPRARLLPPRPDGPSSSHTGPDETETSSSQQGNPSRIVVAAKPSLVDSSPCPAYHPPSSSPSPEPVPPPSASPSPPPNSPPYLAAGRLLPLPPPPAAPPAVWLIKQIRGLCARTDCGLLLAASAKGSID